MITESKGGGSSSAEHLTTDPRWLLLRRIVQSKTMKRAAQLRKMLTFVTEFSLLHPDDQLREQEIASSVLGRKINFDPAYDNIVRVQASNLRHKLSDYFAKEGADEPLILTIPKGSYVPLFVSKEVPSEQSEGGTALRTADEPSDQIPRPATLEANESQSRLSKSRRRLAGVAVICVILLASAFFAHWTSKNPNASGRSAASELFPFMLQRGNKVFIILPDTSLLMLQKLLNLEISVEMYTNSSFPVNLMEKTEDPQLRKALQFVGSTRTTTPNEAAVAMDFVQMLSQDSAQGEIRYARDLRVRDLGEGNYILIGNQRSNPWVSLFANRTYFKFVEDGDKQNYVFKNSQPKPGEAEKYIPYISQKETINYVDIVLTPNLTESGYVLLIIGSDFPANEAAARFLLRGKFPPAIQSELRRGDLRTVEVLLKGHHLRGESNDEISIVTYRSQSK